MNINWNDQNQVQKLIEDYMLRLLKINSITSNFYGIGKAFNELEKICNELNFCYERAAYGMVMRISNNPINFNISCKLAIVCHIDTVAYDPLKWSYNPLGEIKNNRIYGRGVIDDKCAIVLSLLAAKAYENYFNEPWIIIVGCSEEDVWVDMEQYNAENHPIPDYATTIDGDGVQSGCRGCANVKFFFNREYFKGCRLKEINIPGSANNIIPGYATAVFSDGFQVSSKGKSCHSSIPENGTNALLLLARSIAIPNRKQFPGFFDLMCKFNNNSLDEFDSLKIDTSLTQQSYIPSTICPTTCSIEDDTLILNLNFRISIGTDKDDFFNILYELASKLNSEIEISSFVMPNFVESNSPIVLAQLDAYKQIIGHNTLANIARGTGYNAAFKARYGCNIFGPRFAPEDDEEDLCHCNDESRSIEDLIKFYKMLCIFMKNFLS